MMMDRQSNNVLWFIAFCGLILFAAIIIYPIAYTLSSEDKIVTVKNKERVITESGSGNSRKITSKYIVFAEEGEFEVTDTILFFDFRSSTRYNKLVKGHKCQVKVAGWRNGFLSMYENIWHVEKCVENKIGN